MGFLRLRTDRRRLSGESSSRLHAADHQPQLGAQPASRNRLNWRTLESSLQNPACDWRKPEPRRRFPSDFDPDKTTRTRPNPLTTEKSGRWSGFPTSLEVRYCPRLPPICCLVVGAVAPGTSPLPSRGDAAESGHDDAESFGTALSDLSNRPI